MTIHRKIKEYFFTILPLFSRVFFSVQVRKAPSTLFDDTARPPPIQVLPNAVKRVSELISNHLKSNPDMNKDSIGIRLGIKTRGCSGMSYTMSYDDTEKKFDEVVRQDGITLFIEPKALMHVVHSQMDFVEDKISSKFVFINPNAKSICGCGESFQT